MIANTFGSLQPDLKESYAGKKKMKPRLGSGERFAHLKNMLAKKPGIKDPGALAAKIGRKKYGKEKFQKLAAHGKKEHSK